MANAQHVARVKSGADAIAEWRRQNQGVRLDLVAADLSRARLVAADLSRAQLMVANLARANVSGASLSRADLTGAALSEANLAGANLSGACLAGAHFRTVMLTGADLSNAIFGATIVTNCDLSNCVGLEAALHGGSSSIGVDTLISSFRGAGGSAASGLTAFFLGAGVPQEMLDALPAIVREIKYHSCFISYGEPDRQFAEKLRENLLARGVSCWFFPADYIPGIPPERQIKQKIREYEKLVVVCSSRALVREGVLDEIEEQIPLNPDNIIPVLLDHTWREDSFPVKWENPNTKAFLERQAYVDFSDPSKYEEALDRLLKGLGRTDEQDA